MVPYYVGQGSRAGPPPSPAPSRTPSRRASPKHRRGQGHSQASQEGLLRPFCAVYSMRLPQQQVQEHKSHLAAAIATANAASDRASSTNTTGKAFSHAVQSFIHEFITAASSGAQFHLAASTATANAASDRASSTDTTGKAFGHAIW